MQQSLLRNFLDTNSYGPSSNYAFLSINETRKWRERILLERAPSIIGFARWALAL